MTKREKDYKGRKNIKTKLKKKKEVQGIGVKILTGVRAGCFHCQIDVYELSRSFSSSLQ